MFAPPPIIEAKPYVTIEEAQPTIGRRAILEGPSFDRDGNLYLVDIHAGGIYRVAPDGGYECLLRYDGAPNGLKIHRDGRIFVADYRNGLMLFDPAARSISPVFEPSVNAGFLGLNDLIFASNGDMYFTDQGDTGWHDQRGRVWRWREGAAPECLLSNVPSPNGLVLSHDETQLLLAVTRANAIWRVPLLPDGGIGRVGTFIQMSGGTGPDGMALDEEGNLLVAHVGMGSAWLFSALGRPLAEIQTPKGLLVTNLCYGGKDNRTVFITEAQTATVLTAELQVPGAKMYSHS